MITHSKNRKSSNVKKKIVLKKLRILFLMKITRRYVLKILKNIL